MTRLGLIASSALIAAASAAQAAPYTFEAAREESSLHLTCGLPAQPCTRLKASFDFTNASATSLLAPAFNFGLIEFEGWEPPKPPKSNSKSKNGKKDDKPKKSPDQEDKFGSSFGITTTLAFRILGVEGLYNVIATGRGDFKVDEEDVTFLTLLWDEIADVTIPGVGTFAFSFDNLGNSTPFLRQSSRNDTDDTNEENGSDEENGENLILSVNATVENISVVPLPGGAVLLLSALGLIGIGAARRRRATA